MTRTTRPISWIKAARKDFEEIPAAVREDAFEALSTIADGGTSTLAKALTGLGSGVMELEHHPARSGQPPDKDARKNKELEIFSDPLRSEKALVLRDRGDVFRVVYTLQLGPKVWVVHAFQKKSKIGIKTPKAEIDMVRERLRRLKEALP